MVNTPTTLILPPPRSNAVFVHNHPNFSAEETDGMVTLTQRRSGLYSARAREANGKNRCKRRDAIDAKIAINPTGDPPGCVLQCDPFVDAHPGSDPRLR